MFNQKPTKQSQASITVTCAESRYHIHQCFIDRPKETLRSTWPTTPCRILEGRNAVKCDKCIELQCLSCERKGVSIQPSSPISSKPHPIPSHPIFQPSHPNPPNQSLKMQSSTLALTTFTTLTSATVLERAPTDLCPALDTPRCCQVDVDGVTDPTHAPRGSNTTTPHR